MIAHLGRSKNNTADSVHSAVMAQFQHNYTLTYS
jgi:hypothetical protein